MNELLTKVKQNLILEHSADDELISGFITAAVSYAESYQHLPGNNAVLAFLRIEGRQYRRLFRGQCSGGETGVGYGEYAAAAGQAVESMSFGKMNTQIQITQKRVTLDDEGFQTESDAIVAEVRAYREGRHGSEKWANRAAFSEATDLFRFRTIPGMKITMDMRLLCGDSVFEITSVEDVKGRGMYIEVLAKEVQPSG